MARFPLLSSKQRLRNKNTSHSKLLDNNSPNGQQARVPSAVTVTLLPHGRELPLTACPLRALAVVFFAVPTALLLSHCHAQLVQTPAAPKSTVSASSSHTTTTPPPTDARATPISSVPPVSSSSPRSGATTDSVTSPRHKSTGLPKDSLTFHPVLDGNVQSLAFGRKGRVAAIVNDTPWLKATSGWKPIPLPPRLRRKAPKTRVDIYFGRDNAPRLMGSRWVDDGPEGKQSFRPIYLRWRRGAWRKANAEIGRLGGAPPGGLYGVLGFDDPEVVCKTADVCIIKRRTGWKTTPAPGGLARIVRTMDGSTWALGSTKANILKLAVDHWVEVPWMTTSQTPRDIATDDKGTTWFVASDALMQCEDNRCTQIAVPVHRPRAVAWTQSPRALWVVGGDETVLRRETQQWTQLDVPGGHVQDVVQDGEGNVWLLGSKHLWLKEGARGSGGGKN